MKKPIRAFYSLNRAIEYLNEDLGYSTLKIDDLIHFIKREELTTTFQMEGVIYENNAYITSVCEKPVEPLNIENITIQYTNLEYSKSEKTGLLRSYTQSFKNDLLNITFQHHERINKNTKIKQPYARLLNMEDKENSLSIDNLVYITFKGYFQIYNSQYLGSDAEIVRNGYIEINPLSLFHTPIYEPIKKISTISLLFKDLDTPLKLNFDSIEISHDDLERFIGLQKSPNVSQSQTQEKQERISSPQKQLFALLVKKCYSNLDSRNKIFDVINADLKNEGIRDTPIKADTFYKLIDESADFTKAIFPPKKS